MRPWRSYHCVDAPGTWTILGIVVILPNEEAWETAERAVMRPWRSYHCVDAPGTWTILGIGADFERYCLSVTKRRNM